MLLTLTNLYQRMLAFLIKEYMTHTNSAFSIKFFSYVWTNDQTPNHFFRSPITYYLDQLIVSWWSLCLKLYDILDISHILRMVKYVFDPYKYTKFSF